MSERPIEEYTADVMRSAAENHIWLNAFSTIRPTDDFLRDLGRMVLDKLNHPDRVIVPRLTLIDSERELILRVNKS